MSLVAGDRPIAGLGAMRLSTDPDRDEARAIEVLHAAFDAGIDFIDTADAYCREAAEAGHNERLIARAIATWNGDRSRIRVATKGGLTRPEGRWQPDGRARHLIAACEASRRALGVERISLYQLHAPDPKTPLPTSVRALAALQRDGVIGAIGLCNVNVGQIKAAREVADIAAVQVELSVWHDESLLNGVAEYCISNGIVLLAYRPIGGLQRRRRTSTDPVLNEIAGRHEATPFEIAIAWVRDLSPHVVPIAGATRVETVRSIAKASAIALTPDDRQHLEERVPASRRLRAAPHVPITRSANDAEVVLVMGLPGAGKSRLAESLAAQGYQRLSRDERGGSVSDLLPELGRLVGSGVSRIVLDNTYVSRKSRAAVLESAWRLQLPVRCMWLTTSLEDAQVNAAWRLVSRYGRLLAPEELRKMSRQDVAAFAPTVQFRYLRELEPPEPAEGFSRIDVIPFERQPDPSYRNHALIFWCEDVLCRSRSGHRAPASRDDVEVFAGRAEVLRRYQADGWRLLGVSWQPGIADNSIDPTDVTGAFERLQELLGVTIDIEYCPHPAGPPACWCRKPLPGLGVLFVHRHRLDPSRCIYVGSGAQDPAFARRLRFQYQDASDFFARAHHGQAS